MPLREPLRIVGKKRADQVGCEIADVITSDPVLYQAQFFEVASTRDGLLTEVAEKLVKVLMQRPRKVWAEATAIVCRPL